MGGGVSKIEYERVRKELLLKDQVIRTLQERLDESSRNGGAGNTRPSATASRAERAAAAPNGNEDPDAAANDPSPAIEGRLVEGGKDVRPVHRDTGILLPSVAASKVSRLSYAVTTGASPHANFRPIDSALLEVDEERDRMASVRSLPPVSPTRMSFAGARPSMAITRPARPTTILTGSELTSAVSEAAATQSSENKSTDDGSSPQTPMARRRVEVSAEVISNKQILAGPSQRTVHPKDANSKALLLQVLRSNVLFTGLTSAEMGDCLDAFFPMLVAPGAVVIQQGDVGDNFYTIEAGEVEILVTAVNGSPPVRYGFLSTGMGFGELALLYNMPRAATIRATAEAAVSLWALERNTFREILASHKLKRLHETLRALRNVSLLNKLTTSELQQMAAAMEWEEYPAHTPVIRQGEVGEHFFVITRGEILVTQVDADSGEETRIRTMKAGDHFGEMALFKDEVRSATCTTTSPAQCLTLGREHFIAMLGTLEELMDRDPPPTRDRKMTDGRAGTAQLQRTKSNDAGQSTAAMSAIPTTTTYDGSYKYYMQIPKDELEILQTLGRGAFGRVKLVRHIPTGSAFALKCLVKSRIVENNLREHVLNEKRVMMELDHPFILRLLSTYKDRKYLYFLVELALGGELFTYLRRRDRFEEPVARFYIASVVLVFQHMHSKRIAYRDLKPENILLDTDGFMKLADFGLAKVVTDRTWTLCGTPDYLAPEIILNKGHDKAVDYWSLGVLIFELMTGTAPFFAHDPMNVYALIIQGSVRFPSHFGCVQAVCFVGQAPSDCDLLRGCVGVLA
jgi:CRP-like cAMP-binding protein